MSRKKTDTVGGLTSVMRSRINRLLVEGMSTDQIVDSMNADHMNVSSRAVIPYVGAVCDLLVERRGLRAKVAELGGNLSATLSDNERIGGLLSVEVKRVAELEGERDEARAEVERLRAACESAMHDLRSHDGDDEGGYLDDTEQELRKALGLCPNCTDGMEQSGRARITCGTCGDSGKSKEGVV